MKRRVVITGVGALSVLGDDPSSIHRSLCEGRHGRRPLLGFELPSRTVSEAGQIAFEARRYLPQGNLRPLDRTGQLVTSAAQLALDDSGWDAERRREHPVGLTLGTMFGSVRTIAAFDQRALEAGPQYVKPFDFANSVINAAAGQTAIWHHLWGLNSTLTGGPTAGAQAMAYAADLISIGRASSVLAGGGDELCFESLFSADQAGLLAPGRGEGARPFDRQRSGMSLSEGAALLMLEEASGVAARGGRAYGEILGHATAFDPSRGTDRELGIEVLTRTLKQALEEAAIDPGEVTAISASALGSPRVDACEAQALDRVFGAELPPVSAVKGGLGESLGASAALQAVVILESWRQGRMPGVVGLEEHDDTLPLPRLSAEPFAVKVPGPVLLVAVGLDGNVGAMVLAPAT